MEAIVETDRLILRRWKESDRNKFAKMNSDPIVMEYFVKTLTFGESDSLVERIKNRIETKGYGLWAAELKEGHQFMGFLGLNYTDFESDFTPCIEIAWRLAKEYWGNGYATEGAKATLHYGFSVLGIPEIFSFTSILNLKSENVMKKIGMEKVKEFNHPKIDPNNRLCSHVLYRIRSQTL
jgi:ribosomal-protein-alanine N-acetyltransferase